MCNIPNPNECIEYLQVAGCSNEVIKHCIAVRDVAVKIAFKTNADLKIIEAGALLHDIGRSKTHGITHGVEGAKIANKLGLPSSIIHIIERHIGAGLPKDEAVKLGLPPKDYLPITLEEKIVCHADSLIDHNTVQFIDKQVEKAKKQGLELYAKRLVKLHQELSNVCGIDIDDLLRV